MLRFGGVGEAMQLGSCRAPWLCCVGHRRRRSGELLIISESTANAMDAGVEGQGVGHAGFVDDHQCRRPDRCCPLRKVAMVKRPGEFGEGVGADAGLLARTAAAAADGARPST